MADKSTADSKPTEAPNVWVRNILNPSPRPGTRGSTSKKRKRPQGDFWDTVDTRIEDSLEEVVERRILEVEKRVQEEVESRVKEAVERRIEELENRLQHVEEGRAQLEAQVGEVMTYRILDDKIEKRVEEAVERRVQEVERKIQEELGSRVQRVEEAWVRLEDQLAQARAAMLSQQQPLVTAPEP